MPAFYAVAVGLLALATVSAAALALQPPGATGSAILFHVRATIAVLFGGLLTFWAGVAAVMITIAGMVGGSAIGLWIALLVLLVWLLGCGVLWQWVRGSAKADIGVLFAVVLFCGIVYSWQRAWLCEPLAYSGFGPAQLCTAKLYTSGSGGVIRDRNTARAWYRQAAEKGLAQAQYEVGLFTRDRKEKAQWLTSAAKQGDANAALELYFLLASRQTGSRQTGSSQTGSSQTGVDYLRQASAAGLPAAQYYLGRHYLNGSGGLERNLDKVRELWNEAAKEGNLSAMQSLAIAWARDGVLFEYSDEKSRYWESQAKAIPVAAANMRPLEGSFAVNWERILQEVRARRAAADQGDEKAMLAIGEELLKRAEGDEQLRARGMAWVERAARAGSTEARFQAAEFYLESDPDEGGERGRKWLVVAADSGHEAALQRLITALKEGGDGFERDLERSRTYSEALLAGLKARGVKPNQGSWMGPSWEYADTLSQIRREREQYLPPRELQRAADSGDSIAQYHLGKEQMRTDYEGGIGLLEASAEAGYAQAQFEMSRMIRHRKRTSDEEARAIAWLQAAADAGHRGAMVDLGQIYLRGLPRHGIEKNPYRARLLFEASLRGVGDVVYEQKRPGGSWQYTASSVNRWLERIPAPISRLQLDGLEGEARAREISEWYERESRQLQRRIELSTGEETAVLNSELEVIATQAALLSETPRDH